MIAKHSVSGEWSSLNVGVLHGVGLWRGVMNGCVVFVRNTNLEDATEEGSIFGTMFGVGKRGSGKLSQVPLVGTKMRINHFRFSSTS